MYLEIGCPVGYEHLDGRVEYTIASMRDDYDWSNQSHDRPRVARMTRGSHISPPASAPDPDNRLEAQYEITLEQARCLQQDTVFSEAYVLLRANSSSGLRAVLESCGLQMPAHVVNGGGVFGEFPGIDADPGTPIQAEDWLQHGLPEGPSPVPMPPSSQ